MIPAGGLKPRANDTDYRFRVDTAHVYLSGNQSSDAVLLIDDGDATLFFRPRHAKSDDAFWRDGRYGEAWAGRRRSLAEAEELFGLKCRHIYELPEALATGGPARLHRGVDADVDRLLARQADQRPTTNLRCSCPRCDWSRTSGRWVNYKTLSMRRSSASKTPSREWAKVLEHGERWLEGTFFRRARAAGNDIGYESIVAGGPHATTLHWIDNSGPVSPAS